MDKKKISIAVPVFNEQDNIETLYNRVSAVMEKIPQYEYEIVFFDDGSTDMSRQIIEKLSSCDPHVCAVFYKKNYGYAKNIFYSVQQSKGDAVILIHADMQNPPELIPQFIEKWESGEKIVLGVKNKSLENKFMYFLRTVFYKIMNVIFGLRLIPHATDFGLFDRSFVEELKEVKSNRPFLRGIELQFCQNPGLIYYTQDKRQEGKTHFNLSKYYSFAIDGIVGYSRVLPRRIILASVIGIVLTVIEFLAFCLPRIIILGGYLCFSNTFFIHVGVALIFTLLICVSIFAEYVFTVKDNLETKPLILEEKRMNY